MRTLLLLTSLGTITAAASAQSYVASPPQGLKYETTAALDFFNAVSRTQQICTDLKGTARTFTGIAWRRDGTYNTNATFVGRLVDVEILCCNSNHAATSATFASNYVGAPTTVFTRKALGTADLSQLPDVTPAPWSVSFAFDTPFAYAGVSDFLYEVKVYSSNSGNAYPLDAATSRSTSLVGPLSTIGTGCTTVNGSMRVRAMCVTDPIPGSNTASIGWTVTKGPTAAPAGLLIGATNPNVWVPTLCGGKYLYTDGIYLGLLGSTDALGSWIIPTASVPWNPIYAGTVFTAQAAALDFTQGGLNVAASNGITSEVAPAAQTFAINRVAATTTSAATGTITAGLALTTRLQY